MKTIYFVRHGESVSNVAGIVSGAGNDTPLTTNGRLQAKQAGRSLKGKGIQLVICSPLSRAVETAEIIATAMGYDPAKIVRNPLFIERNCGVYEGTPEKQWFADIANNRLHHSVETTEQMYTRLTKAVESLRGYKESKILVVSHGGASRALQVINQKLHHSQMYEIEKLGNAEIYEFAI